MDTGVSPYCCTLDSNFRAPFIREYILAHGLRSCSRRSLLNILGSRPGNSVVLVPGGAAESLLVKPGTLDLVSMHGCRRVLGGGARAAPVVMFSSPPKFSSRMVGKKF